MRRRGVFQRAVLGTAAWGLAAAGAAAAEIPGTRADDAVAENRKPELRARDGTTLFHRDWGSGRPVLFLHGWGLACDFWDYQMEFVASAGFRAVAFDRRSHGRSGDPGRGYDYDTLADDVATVIGALGLRDITIVAHSLGAGEAVRYLTRHGTHAVTGLVLVGATLPFLLRTPDNAAGIPPTVFAGLRATLATDRAKWLADNAASFWMPDTSPAMMAWGNAMPWRCSLRAMRALTHTMSETDFRDELRALQLRTLLVHGTADRSVPVEFARAAAALITGSDLREYDGAPHGLPLTHMARFNADLATFVRT